MLKWIPTLVLLLTTGGLQAQNIAINETGAAPDPSAMLDISSPDKGFLTPRLADHTIIASPATGLLVYNTTTSTFWFFDGTQWIEITFPVSELRDADDDTWISVENTPDEDIIRFAAASATSQMHFDGKTLNWTSNNIFIGNLSGAASSGNNNTFLGDQTASGLGAGNGNVITGSQAAFSMSSGDFNTVVGTQSGYSMTSGTQNVFVGALSGALMSSADDNTLIGYRSGYNMTTASDNTLIGSYAGHSLTTGTRNTYVGESAGRGNVTGNDNVAIGRLACGEGFTSIGGESVYVGVRAGRYANSNANVMVGFGAGQYSTSAFNNTFVGFYSGEGINTGNNPGSENAFFGSQSGRECNGCQRNVYVGMDAARNISSGSNNFIAGWRAGFNLTTGSFNVILGSRAGEFLPSNASQRLVIANSLSAGNVLIWGEFDNQRVGINTTAPDQNFTVNGSASKTGGGTWLAFSDKRVKQDIGAFSDGLDVLMELNPVRFKYKANSGYDNTNQEFIGFIAQDVEKVAPYMVSLFDDSEGPSGLADKRVFDESALNKILVNAVQEQQEHIESLEARILRLENLLLEQSGNTANTVAEK